MIHHSNQNGVTSNSGLNNPQPAREKNEFVFRRIFVFVVAFVFVVVVQTTTTTTTTTSARRRREEERRRKKKLREEERIEKKNRSKGWYVFCFSFDISAYQCVVRTSARGGGGAACVCVYIYIYIRDDDDDGWMFGSSFSF